ncbi:MAG: DUF1559 domain-containing protein, partial [Lacipirellulaceae bacterium]
KTSYVGSVGSVQYNANGGASCPEVNGFNEFSRPFGDPSGAFKQSYSYTDPTVYPGAFTRHGVATRLVEVTDGLSNTIFFGEVRRDCSTHVRSGWLHPNNGSGLCGTSIPLNYDSCQPESTNGCQQPKNWNTSFGFKSNHPGGVVCGFGDGSIHFVSENIDHWTLQFLGDKADGQVVGTF